MKFLAIAILSIAVPYCTAEASAQITCSPAQAASNNLPAGNQPTTPGARLLRDLVDQRLSLMTEVAKAKWNSGSAIEDPTREQQLLADVAAKSPALGISANWAQHFFRLQIEAAKQVQYCLFAQWTAERQQPFPQVEDLKTEIRPKLDLLTTELLQELAKQWPELTQHSSPEHKDSRPADSTARDLAWLPLTDGSLRSLQHAH
jgi:cyclohexadienyl dehydratase